MPAWRQIASSSSWSARPAAPTSALPVSATSARTPLAAQLLGDGRELGRGDGQHREVDRTGDRRRASGTRRGRRSTSSRAVYRVQRAAEKPAARRWWKAAPPAVPGGRSRRRPRRPPAGLEHGADRGDGGGRARAPRNVPEPRRLSDDGSSTCRPPADARTSTGKPDSRKTPIMAWLRGQHERR